MKVTLITPPSGFLLDERVFPTLGILRVGASLRAAGVDVDHLDLSGVSNYLDVIRDYKEESIFAITATTPQMPAAVKIARELKGRSILGGPHVTLVNAAAKRGNIRAQVALFDLQTEFDCLVAGDGEQAIFDALIKTSGIIDADDPKSELWQTSQKFTESPWPDRSLVDMESYHYTIDGVRATSMISQLGCPFESVTADTFIFTSRGFETLEALQSRLRRALVVNDQQGSVISIAEAVATKDGWKEATYFIKERVRDVYEVRHQFGIPLRGTAEHLIMAVNGEQLEWRSISSLHKNDWIACRFPEITTTSLQPLTITAKLRPVPPGGFHSREIRIPGLMDEELAWLTGFMLGDGCLPLDGRPSIHVCVTDGVRERLIAAFRNLFDCDLRIYATDTTTKMQHGWVHSRAIYEFFVQTLGISPEKKLNVPAIIRKSPRSVIQAFLDGLWDADGYSDARSSYLTTVNGEFARQIAMLLLMVRKIPLLHRIKGNGYAQGECWRIGIVKGERFPTDRLIYRSYKSGKWYWRTRKSKNRSGIRRRTLKAAGLTHPLDLDGIFYSRVRDIVPAGNEMVYDLTVPDGENFIASGIVVHNCGFCGGRFSPMLRRIRTRPAGSVIAEMMYLFDTYGYRGINLFDDELNVNRGMVELMRKIAASGIDWKLRGFVKSELFTEEQAEVMYAAGFRWLLCGFESGHPRILHNINKKATLEDNTRMLQIAHKHGLKVKALMSIGHPGESERTIYATRDWLLQQKPDDFDLTVITVYPGTPYHDDAELCGEHYRYEFNGDVLYSMDMDFTKDAAYYKGAPGEYHSFVWTDYLTARQLVGLRDEVEEHVRYKLRIPYPTAAAAVNYEHSMGQSLPQSILRGVHAEV